MMNIMNARKIGKTSLIFLMIITVFFGVKSLAQNENWEVLWKSGEVYYPQGEIEVYVEVTHESWQVRCIYEGDAFKSYSFTYDVYLSNRIGGYYYWKTYQASMYGQFLGRGSFLIKFHPRYITFMRLWIRQDLNSAPEPITSELSLTSTLDNFKIGESISLSGAIEPIIADIEILLTIRRPDLTNVEIKTKTDSEGHFDINFVSDQTGSWSARASWEGDLPEIWNAWSSWFHFEVELTSLDIACEINPINPGVNDSVLIYGSLFSEVQGSVNITYVRPDTTSFSKILLLSNGCYEDILKLDQAGEWKVIVIKGADSFYYETKVEKDITVQKKSRDLTFNLSTNRITIGESIELYGAINLKGEPLNVEITITHPKINTLLVNISSLENGTFSQMWIPNEVGEYSIQGHVDGSAIYDVENSNVLSLFVDKIFTSISHNVSSLSLEEGDSIDVFGVLYPIITLSELPSIILEFNKIGSTNFNYQRAAQVLENGFFNDSSKPSELGDWQVIVKWDGDNFHNGSMSDPISFTYGSTPEPDAKLEPEVQSLGTIRIRVYDDTRSPLSKVTVYSSSQPEGQSSLDGTTSSDGEVTFHGVLTGEYVIKAIKQEYESATNIGGVAPNDILDLVFYLEDTETESEAKTIKGIPGFPIISIMIGILWGVIILRLQRARALGYGYRL